MTVETLKKAFLNTPYDAQLVQQVNNQHQPDSYWTWTPLWDQATQTTIPDSATYTYVPLEPRLPGPPYVVTMVGVRQYLRCKQTARGLRFAEAAYLFKEAENVAFSPATAHAFFATYTGLLVVRELATGERSQFAFVKGARQPYSGARAGKGADKTTSCYTSVECYWSGVCTTEVRDYPMVYGTWTTSANYCVEPLDNGVGCSHISWHVTNSNSYTICSPDGSGDPGGDPNGGGNGGCTNCGPSGPTGPTPPTNLNSPCGKMYTLGTKTGFQTAIGVLNQPSFLRGTKEAGFIYTGNGDNFANYGYVSGTRSNIVFQLTFPINGTLHIHNLDANVPAHRALSVPSPTDLINLYDIFHEGNMIDSHDFTATVITAFGDMYAFKIENESDFRTFGNNYLSGPSGYIDGHFFCPDCGFPLQAGNASMLGQTAFKVSSETNLLRFLNDNHSGLKLFKYDPTNANWQQRNLDANKNLVNELCP